VFAGARQSPFRIHKWVCCLGSVHQDPPESTGLAVKLAVTYFWTRRKSSADVRPIHSSRTAENSINGFLARRHKIRSAITGRKLPTILRKCRVASASQALPEGAFGSQFGSHLAGTAATRRSLVATGYFANWMRRAMSTTASVIPNPNQTGQRDCGPTGRCLYPRCRSHGGARRSGRVYAATQLITIAPSPK
jgi:hypothetical protein